MSKNLQPQMSELQLLKTLIFLIAPWKLQNEYILAFFSDLNSFLPSVLMVVPSPSVNMKRLQDGNVRFLVVIN